MNQNDLDIILSNYSLEKIIKSLVEIFGIDTIKEILANLEYWNEI